MPRLTVTAPDGTKYNVDAPEGATDAEVLTRVRGQWQQDIGKERATAAAGGLMGAAGPLGVSGLETVDPGAVVRGITRGIGGIGQALMDVVGLGSERAAEFGGRIPQIVRDISPENLSSYTSPEEARVSEGVGEMAPAVSLTMIPGLGGVFTGALAAGATGLQDYPSLGERWLHRGIETGAAGLLGGGGSLAFRGGMKLLGAKELDEIGKGLQSEYEKYDPAITKQRQVIVNSVERKRAQWQGFKDEAARTGDSVQPNVEDMQGKIRDAVAGTKGKGSLSKDARELLGDVQRTTGADVAMPSQLTVGGRTFTRDANTGLYVGPTGSLPADVAERIAQASGAGPPNVRYSTLKAMVEKIDGFLADNPAKDAATNALRDVRRVIDSKVADIAKATGATRLEERAQKFFDKNIRAYDNPKVKEFLETSGERPTDKANLAIDIALGDDREAAVALAGLLDKKGMEAVHQGVMQKALAAAADKSGEIDPVKFVRFFEDKPGLGPFKDAKTDNYVKGMSELMKESALRQGESKAPSLSLPRHTEDIGMGSAIWSLLHLHPKTAAASMATAIGAHYVVKPTFDFFNRVLGDGFGRLLLVAASKAPAGSPRAARIYQQIMVRFGGPAAAEATRGAGTSR